MTATYEITYSGKTRLMMVEGIRNAAEANAMLKTITDRHADSAKLINLDEYVPRYTVQEVRQESFLFGGPRRYSTGTRTVTIPE